MSYEGYLQCLCENGHRFDDHDIYGEEPTLCPHCNSDSVWRNGVDQTNGNDVGYIPPESFDKYFLLKDAVTETCPHCQHVAVIEQKTYRIPKEEELDEVKTIRGWDDIVITFKEMKERRKRG